MHPRMQQHDPPIHRSVHVQKRENAIVNRLNKTKDERTVDHEAERIERVKSENAAKRVAAAAKVKYFHASLQSGRTDPEFDLAEKG